MSVALTSRWFAAGAGPEALAAGLEALRVRHLVLDDPPPTARRWRDTLKAGGVEVVAVRLGAAGAPSAAATEIAAALKARRVVVGGGPIEAPSPTTFATPPAAEDLGAQRQRVRARQVESLARALHGPLASGVPLAVRHAAEARDLLRLEEVGWLLDALPRLQLWLDPARLLALARAGQGAAPEQWVERLAGRVCGVSVHGLGSDGRGHAHPEDDGPPWGRLAASLPRQLPWALDLSGRLTADDVREAVRCLEAAFAVPG